MGRATQGVRLMNLLADEKIVSIGARWREPRRGRAGRRGAEPRAATPARSSGVKTGALAARLLRARARAWIPGGVNSPVRAFGAVGGTPLFVARGKGAQLSDADGNRYIDYVGSWGPLILGHAHPAVLRAVRAARARTARASARRPSSRSSSRAASCAALPSLERVRFVSSGTEATMSALRLARGATGRPRILKFEGCYHGHADALLVGAGSGVATLGIPGSPGVPAAFAELTVPAPYNDLAAVAARVRALGRRDRLRHRRAGRRQHGLRAAASRASSPGCASSATAHGALLIFDEVMTGFRVARGGAQALYGVRPDLTCLGKVVGGGLPAAAYGGPRELMDRDRARRPGLPGRHALGKPARHGGRPRDARPAGAARGIYEQLEARSQRARRGSRRARRARPASSSRPPPSAACSASSSTPARSESFADARKADAAALQALLPRDARGGRLPGAVAYEAGFVSLAHRPPRSRPPSRRPARARQAARA